MKSGTARTMLCMLFEERFFQYPPWHFSSALSRDFSMLQKIFRNKEAENA